VVSHPNSPLTPQGRRRLCERVDSGRPIAHVAAEAGISRQCLAKWYDSEAERRLALVDFLNHYNYDRPHAAIGHKPPASRVPLATYRLTAEGITDVVLPQRFEQMSIDDILA
jgi:hypothetical protein